MEQRLVSLLWLIYNVGAWGTWIYLTFLDGVIYSFWNWIFILPMNFMQAVMWPMTWLLRAVM